MRAMKHTLRLDSDAVNRSSAIAKLQAADLERQREFTVTGRHPGKAWSDPVETLGHAVHRAITENA